MKMKTQLIGLIGLLALSTGAQAADGALCQSPIVTNVYKSTYLEQTFAQLSNDTKFTCLSAGQYTIKDLSRAGWIIDNMGSTLVSIRTTVDSSTGVVTTTTKSRYQFTIQK